MGKKVVELIAELGLTHIPEPHTPLFHDMLPNSSDLLKLKKEEYVNSFRECIAANCDLEGFVTQISGTFFNIPRERMGNKDKEKAIKSWLEIFGTDAKFIFLDVKNPFIRAVVKKQLDLDNFPVPIKKSIKKEDIINEYKHHIKKDTELWQKNDFQNNEQIVCLFIEDLVDGDEESWKDLEEHIGINIKKKEININKEKFEEQCRISKEVNV